MVVLVVAWMRVVKYWTTVGLWCRCWEKKFMKLRLAWVSQRGSGTRSPRCSLRGDGSKPFVGLAADGSCWTLIALSPLWVKNPSALFSPSSEYFASRRVLLSLGGKQFPMPREPTRFRLFSVQFEHGLLLYCLGREHSDPDYKLVSFITVIWSYQGSIWSCLWNRIVLLFDVLDPIPSPPEWKS